MYFNLEKKMCLTFLFTACKVLQNELNRKILDSLLDFTRKCLSTHQHSDWALQMRASEIPTAALVLGMWTMRVTFGI